MKGRDFVKKLPILGSNLRDFHIQNGYNNRKRRRKRKHSSIINQPQHVFSMKRSGMVFIPLVMAGYPTAVYVLEEI